MFRSWIGGRAGLGVFIREFLEARSGERREFCAFETREVAVPPLAKREPAPQPLPASMAAARSGGRLIDLERRAKFGQFVS